MITNGCLDESFASYYNKDKHKYATRVTDYAFAPTGIGEGKKYFIMTHVLIDGFGDLFNMLGYVKTIKQIFEGSEVKVLFTHAKPIPNINLEEYSLTPDDCLALSRDGDVTQEVFAQAIEDFLTDKNVSLTSLNNFIKYFKEADLGINAPIEFLTADIFETLIKQVPILAFYESDRFYAGTHWLSFKQSGNNHNWQIPGFSSESKGVNIPTIARDEIVKPEHQKIFENNDKTFFCYMKAPENFIRLILQANTATDDNLQIITDSSKLREIHTKEEFKTLLQKARIGRILFIKGDNVSTITLEQNNCRALIIQDPFPLTHTDFLKLTARSEWIVGCTGDVSLLEVLSLGKVPIYEAKGHKFYYWDSFKKLVAHHLPDGKLNSFNSNPEENFHLMNDRQLQQGNFMKKI